MIVLRRDLYSIVVVVVVAADILMGTAISRDGHALVIRFPLVTLVNLVQKRLLISLLVDKSSLIFCVITLHIINEHEAGLFCVLLH